MSIVECFGDVIGLSHGDESDSGLYLSDLEAVSTLVALQDPEIEEPSDDDDSEMNVIFLESRSAAILKLHNDLMTLMMRHTQVRKPFRGKIGSTKWTRSARGGGSLVVVCRPMEHAYIYVDEIAIITKDNEGAFDIALTSDDGSLTRKAETTGTTGGEATIVKGLGWQLPLLSDFDDYMVYRLTHNKDFMDAKLRCGSCTRYAFDFDHPRFARAGLESYVNVSGYKSGRYINSSMGLVMKAEIRCRVDNILCSDNLDFQYDELAHAMAQAIWFKTGSIVVWKALRNPNLNRVLMQNSDDLREAAKYYDRQYRDLVLYINKHYDYVSDCLQPKGMSWGGRIV